VKKTEVAAEKKKNRPVIKGRASSKTRGKGGEIGGRQGDKKGVLDTKARNVSGLAHGGKGPGKKRQS